MKRLLPFLLIPLFITYGPNAVGYETIITGQNVEDGNIPLGSQLACNFVLPDGRHILLEGVLLSKDPLFMLAQTHLGILPIRAKSDQVEFCLISENQMLD